MADGDRPTNEELRAELEDLVLQRARWRQAEAGTVQHLVLGGRPLCAADDAGPWRMVAGVNRCGACTDLEEVLGRHG